MAKKKKKAATKPLQKKAKAKRKPKIKARTSEETETLLSFGIFSGGGRVLCTVVNESDGGVDRRWSGSEAPDNLVLFKTRKEAEAAIEAYRASAREAGTGDTDMLNGESFESISAGQLKDDFGYSYIVVAPEGSKKFKLEANLMRKSGAYVTTKQAALKNGRKDLADEVRKLERNLKELRAVHLKEERALTKDLDHAESELARFDDFAAWHSR